MTRIGGVVVIRLVAADARRGQRGVVVVDVAIRAHARRHGMRSSQRECRVVMVECRIRPDHRVVTEFTGRRETRRGMRRVRGSRVILLMARVAQRTV